MDTSSEHAALVEIWDSVEIVWEAVMACRAGEVRNCQELADALKIKVAKFKFSGGIVGETTAWMIEQVLEAASEVANCTRSVTSE